MFDLVVLYLIYVVHLVNVILNCFNIINTCIYSNIAVRFPAKLGSGVTFKIRNF